MGKRDGLVRIYDIRSKSSKANSLVKTFEGHKSAVTSLAFRTQSLQLFSGSDDRCIRHYNLDDMLYMETLYGHQLGVTALDCHRKERPISVGKDRTARAWKLAHDTHLIFRGGAKMPWADTVSVIKDDWFLTGHQGGNLALWLTDKKKAVSTIEQAHGVDEATGLGRDVISVSSVPGSDLASSGSNDGYVRFWKVTTNKDNDEMKKQQQGLESVFAAPLHGFVNGICLARKAQFCVAAVGQEHRLGRWTRVPRAKNRLVIIKLEDASGAVTNEETSQSLKTT